MNVEGTIEEEITPVLDLKFDVADDLDMQRATANQRHQLFAAAAAGNLSPIPSDNENGEHLVTSSRNSMSEPYDIDNDDIPDDIDITTEQPPNWNYSIDDEDEDDDDEDDDEIHLRRQSHSLGGSNDSLESFEKAEGYRAKSHTPESTNGFNFQKSFDSPELRSPVSMKSPPPRTPTTPTTPQTPTTPKTPTTTNDGTKTTITTPRGARIVVPKTKENNNNTNGTSMPPRPRMYQIKPAKSRLPRMDHIQSTIPKPRPKAPPQQKEEKKSSKAIRENKSSINRKKNLVIQQSRDLEEEAKELDYLTPLQKKNNYIKELEQKLKDTKTKLDEREKEVANMEIIVQDKVRDIIARKDEEIEILRDQIQELEIANEDLRNNFQDAMKTVKAYENTVTEMKNSMEVKEIETKEMYLVMYRKGQESALFDREVQLEELAASAPQTVDVKELLAKLEKTQGELTKWQSIQMSSSYGGGEKPDTEASAKLRFLRDSMFHYLSDDTRDQPQHLKAMIAILGFTEQQMKKIRKAVVEHHK